MIPYGWSDRYRCIETLSAGAVTCAPVFSLFNLPSLADEHSRLMIVPFPFEAASCGVAMETQALCLSSTQYKTLAECENPRAHTTQNTINERGEVQMTWLRRGELWVNIAGLKSSCRLHTEDALITHTLTHIHGSRKLLLMPGPGLLLRSGTNMWPWSTKAVISNTGIFVAIANNTLYGSKLSIFLLCQKSLGY